MKLSKLFLGLLAAFSVVFMFGCITVFADDEVSPSIDVDNMTATIDDSGNVTLVCTINNPVDEQQISVMVAEVVNDTVDFNNPIYLNQYDYDTDAGSFTTTFNVDVSDSKTYAARVGGTDIAEAAYVVITDGTVIIIKGDVNGDDVVDYKDSIYVLRYSALTYNLTEKQIKIADMNDDDIVDYKDSILILRQSAGI